MTEKRENFRPESALLAADQIFALFVDISKHEEVFEEKKTEKISFFENVNFFNFIKKKNILFFKPRIKPLLLDVLTKSDIIPLSSNGDLQQSLKQYLQIPMNQQLSISINFLLSLLSDTQNLDYSAILDLLFSETEEKFEFFLTNVQKTKFQILLSLKNARSSSFYLKKCLEKKHRIALQRVLFQEFIHKVELPVCITNLDARKGYLLASGLEKINKIYNNNVLEKMRKTAKS